MASRSHYPKIISLRKIDVCRAAISPVHQVPTITKPILEDRGHMLYHRTAVKYKAIVSGKANREEEGLWLIVGSNQMQKKRVVRSFARRRILQAVSEQLKVNGFDTKGRRLEGAKEEFAYRGRKIHSLIGLVELYPTDKAINCKYDEILRQAAMLVQEIVERCGVGQFRDDIGKAGAQKLHEG